MKAIRTIGIGKTLKLLWYSWYAWLIDISLPFVRVWLLRLAGAHVGKDTVIFDVRFENLHHYGFTKLWIGDRCFLSGEVMLDVRGGIRMENDVTLSHRTAIVTHMNVGFPEHPLQKRYPSSESQVVIRSGVYVGTGAIILPGVTIGPESVVGAGAVVTASVPSRVLVVGVPARVKKHFGVRG